MHKPDVDFADFPENSHVWNFAVMLGPHKYVFLEDKSPCEMLGHWQGIYHQIGGAEQRRKEFSKSVHFNNKKQ